jgi:hypothetical protein
MSEPNYTDPRGRVQPERRTNLRLRGLFEEAYELVLPFLDPAQSWGEHPLEIMAFRVLRDHYPDLSATELQQLVIAAERVFHARRANPVAAPEHA